MSHTPEKTLAAFKDAVKTAKVEDEFLKVTGLSSLDELNPTNFDENAYKAKTLSVPVSLPSAAPQEQPQVQKNVADAQTRTEYESASDFLYSFKHLQIRYPPRKQVNAFTPCSVVMFLIIHKINSVLCDHFYFLRSAPDYHPGLLRIYFGVLFVIQTLRASHACNNLESQSQHDFLKRFLDAFPPETLAIPAPLLHVFKSLCASQPEIPQYGYVCPSIPDSVDGNTLSEYPTGNSRRPWYLPDIAGILSLMQWQHSSKNYRKGFHPEFPADKDTAFRGRTFSADSSVWNQFLAWSLTCPGIEHPFESGTRLNESFFEDRYLDLGLPRISATTSIESIDEFLMLNRKLTWFSRVRDIASVTAKYFPGSGSLADCSPIGPPVGQLAALVFKPDYPRTLINEVPDKSASPPKEGQAPKTTRVWRYPHGDPPLGFTGDSSYYDDLAFKLETPSRSLPQMAVIMAGASLIHMQFPRNHVTTSLPLENHEGPFFLIQPLEQSSLEEDVFYGISDSIKKAIKDKA